MIPTKYAKCSEKLTFLTPWYAQANEWSQAVANLYKILTQNTHTEISCTLYKHERFSWISEPNLTSFSKQERTTKYRNIKKYTKRQNKLKQKRKTTTNKVKATHPWLLYQWYDYLVIITIMCLCVMGFV